MDKQYRGLARLCLAKCLIVEAITIDHQEGHNFLDVLVCDRVIYAEVVEYISITVAGWRFSEKRLILFYGDLLHSPPAQ